MQKNGQQDNFTITVVNEKTIKPNVTAVSSICPNNKHILFWDFDISEDKIDKIEGTLINLCGLHRLSKIYLFKTRNGYNAICLDKVDIAKAYTIKLQTAYDDRKHCESGMANGHWRLRLGNDKLFVGSYGATYTLYQKSNAHRILLNNLFNLNIQKTDEYDDNEMLLLNAYWCWKETYHG